MNAGQASIDLSHLQSQLLRVRLASQVDAGNKARSTLVTQSRAATSSRSLNPVPRRDTNTRRSRRSQHRNCTDVISTVTPRGDNDGAVGITDGASTNLSFLPNTIPETIDQILVKANIVARRLSMDAEVRSQTQFSDGATQEISQSVLEVVRSRSGLASAHLDDVGEDDLPDTLPNDEEDALQNSLQEGDSNYVDITSSFVPPPLTQFPESQRFKTPAHPTTSKKRDYDGNTLQTPIVSRNPFAKAVNSNNVLGLSQAFAQTQAASSPPLHATTPALPSDRPSPSVEVEKHVQLASTSSPMQPLSDIKRATTEPATRYLPVGHSQSMRSGSADAAQYLENDHTQATNAEDFSGESILLTQRKRREREERSREQLKRASSTISPQKNNPSSRGAGLASPRPAHTRRTSTKSLPSSPPARPQVVQNIDDREGEQPSRTYHTHADDGQLSTAGGSPLPTSLQRRTVPRKGAATVVPDTNRRVDDLSAVPHSFPPSQPSPSVRQTRSGRTAVRGDDSNSRPVRVANSQRSAPSTQEPLRKFLATSSGDSVEMIPASPEAQLIATQPSHLSRSADADFTNHNNHERSTEDSDSELDPDASDMLREGAGHGHRNSTVPETTSGQLSNGHQRTSGYATAPTNQEFDTGQAASDWSSQPVQLPPGRERKRKRLEDISQEDMGPPATQPSSYDPAADLALDKDPELAHVLASTHDDDPIISTKRPKLNHIDLAPRSDVQHTRAPVQAQNATVVPVINPPHSGFNQTGDVDLENVSEANTLNVGTNLEHEKTPTRVASRRSAWDIGESPKPRRILVTRDLQPQMKRATTRQKGHLRVSRNTAKNPLNTPSTLPSIEEASPDPLAISTTSTAQPALTDNFGQIVAPNMIFAYCMGLTRAWYPAVCFGVSIESQKYSIKWPGYQATEEMPRQNLCSLDLRVGDEVKIAENEFQNAVYLVRGLCINHDGSNFVSDIHGNTHALLEPKNIKHSLVKGVGKAGPVPINRIYLGHLSMWNKVNRRRFVFEPLNEATSAPGLSTPDMRAGTPATPPSRSRYSTKDAVRQPAREDGMFAKMVFVLSFDDAARCRLSELILANGGVILEKSFQDLLDEDLRPKERFSSFQFAALLTDKHTRKEKYMQALALGLPCLSGRWVTSCLKQAELASWHDYLLPAGESKELDGAVRSRVLPAMNFDVCSLGQSMVSRPQYFGQCSAVFVTGRGKAADRRKAHGFIVQAMGADDVSNVPDMAAARTHLYEMDKSKKTWLFVEDKDNGTACKLVAELKEELAAKSRRKSTTPAWSCEVADSEYVVQSLILGRLCSREV